MKAKNMNIDQDLITDHFHTNKVMKCILLFPVFFLLIPMLMFAQPNDPDAASLAIVFIKNKIEENNLYQPSDPGVASLAIVDLDDNPLNANELKKNVIYKIRLSIGNFSNNLLHAGCAEARIGLGTWFELAPGFNLATAPLSSIFNWSTFTGGGQLEIIGDLAADIDLNDVGIAEFEIIALNDVGNSIFSTLFNISNTGGGCADSETNTSNNIANLSYTVVNPQVATVITWSYDDGIGNKATQKQNIIINDEINPILGSCPSSQEVASTAGNRTYVLEDNSWDVTATDNYSATVYYTLSGATTSLENEYTTLAGVEFNEGVTTVSVVAIDVGGNTSGSCKFTVTVDGLDIDVPIVTHNLFHGGLKGSIEIVPIGGDSPYNFVITSGPTINAPGASIGIFTNLAAGTYDIMVTDANGRDHEILGITVDEPPSDAVNIVVGATTPGGTSFSTSGEEREIIFTLTEIGGSAATSAEIWIPKPAADEYDLSFDQGAMDVDNSDWDVDDSHSVFLKLIMKNGVEIPGGGQVKVSVSLTRQTSNTSAFPLITVITNVALETANLDNGVLSNIIFN